MLSVRVFRINQSDTKGNDPNPNRLESPEKGKFQDIISELVQTIILSCFQNASKQEQAKPKSPKRNQYSDY